MISSAEENQERADRLHWPDLSCSERGGTREGEGKQKEEPMMRKQDFRDDYRGESSPITRTFTNPMGNPGPLETMREEKQMF